MSFSYQIKQKAFIEASCTSNIHTGEKVFLQLPHLKVCMAILFTVRKLVHTLVCMCPLYISREERGK